MTIHIPVPVFFAPAMGVVVVLFTIKRFLSLFL